MYTYIYIHMLEALTPSTCFGMHTDSFTNTNAGFPEFPLVAHKSIEDSGQNHDAQQVFPKLNIWATQHRAQFRKAKTVGEHKFHIAPTWRTPPIDSNMPLKNAVTRFT